MIEKTNYESYSNIYIKFPSTSVKCYRNKYENLFGFAKGGVYLLEEVDF